MANAAVPRTRVSQILAGLTLAKVVGVGGLGMLCAASLLSLIPPGQGAQAWPRLLFRRCRGWG